MNSAAGLPHWRETRSGFREKSDERGAQRSEPTEFGKLVEVQEAENQIITNYQVFADRPSDQELLVPALRRKVASGKAFFASRN